MRKNKPVIPIKQNERIFPMKIHGFNTLTLLDYPGLVGASLFLGGCNFRCPFCQNGNLVLHPEEEPWIPTEEVLAFLKKRRGILEGVCVSGGEPTLYDDLPGLLGQIKDLGYQVKLDTNGSRPDVICSLRKDGLIDYVAMDIKSSPEGYREVSGCPTLDLDAIKTSVDYLKSGDMDYEFRTTVVKGLHSASDFEAIAHWLEGAHAYFLQAYQDSDHILRPGFSGFSRAQMEDFLSIVQKKIPHAALRGID
jgi:pyruvate formate lyase activating enzyme